AISALMCGGAELTNTLFTDYPGGVAPVISFPFHRKIDFGLAAMTATMPEFMSFHGHPENKFFVTQAAIITAATNLTTTGRPRRAASSRDPTEGSECAGDILRLKPQVAANCRCQSPKQQANVILLETRAEV